ncbi:NUDIX hydrolase [Dehalobacterium formicoaceticum]|uniref:CoA pyrophosphatase n=1 Tax=Dehalobacterium formicoaceticum TaxID=51515 RepID=A0ABT1Y0L8_9FIRM|nr:CoA pyrophosphatase [Dehalobacterium formicoaceticum]
MKHCNIEEFSELFSEPSDIMFRERYLNSAILLLLVFRCGEYHFVFEKRSSQIRQGGEVCFPGGRFDSALDRNFQQTAIRETAEELGITDDKIRVMGKLGTLITPHSVLVEGFLGLAEISFEEIITDPQEVEYVFSVPVSFFEKQVPEEYLLDITINPCRIDENGQKEILFPAEELQVPGKYHAPWQGRKHKVFVYRYQGEVIWGITAAFIYSFIQKCQAQ